MKQLFNQVIMIIITSALLSPILFLGWNYGFVKFISNFQPIQWLDAVIAVGTYQTLSLFSLRKIERQYFPVYVSTPTSESSISD